MTGNGRKFLGFIRHTEEIKSYLVRNGKYEQYRIPFLRWMFGHMAWVPPRLGKFKNIYYQEISKYLKEFNVKDSASDNLLSIRIKIKTNENLLKDKILDELNRYSTYLNSNNYLFKNSTYVLPFKTSYKNKINGMIVDISDSGETTFIVPSLDLYISILFSITSLSNSYIQIHYNTHFLISKVKIVHWFGCLFTYQKCTFLNINSILINKILY